MRKALFAIISPVLAAALLFSACAKPAEQPVIDVTATEAPAPEETAAICGSKKASLGRADCGNAFSTSL